MQKWEINIFGLKSSFGSGDLTGWLTFVQLHIQNDDYIGNIYSNTRENGPFCISKSLWIVVKPVLAPSLLWCKVADW